ncbi:hypothetical protein F0562_012268 [Nyssa sinensis]|uniref:ER membrane protein complex subunit 7 beta-sandwich domain-containing protein n=1 Tax=Nyssa sinensis TaxID=561372 RepID=A0A5J4ZS96_9ASTE|nr:hypothetical protein F0562_012268 [Nyssa sinensis]
MAVIQRSKPIFLTLLFLLPFCFLHSALAISPGNGDGYTINGRVKISSFGLKGFDGYFSFHNVPAGTHLIEVAAIGYFFSPVRVDVSARNPGKVQATLTENRRSLNELVLEPLREEQYYEIREPFSVMSLVKSPMGLMVGFMLIVMFLMPKLVENMACWKPVRLKIICLSK